jgi:transcriptional regulator with XRE-family HTH domain
MTQPDSATRTALRRLRRERGLSQSRPADALHVSPATVRAWERAEQLPRPAQLRALAGVLAMPEVAIRRALGTSRGSTPQIRDVGCSGVGARIYLARLASGWSRSRVARAVGVPVDAIRDWESGFERPSTSDLQRLWTMLGRGDFGDSRA